MLKLLTNPTDQLLLNFLRKLKKEIQNLGVGETLLLPIYVENRELLMILEHTTERSFKVFFFIILFIL
jgi:hypothetical protein